MGEPAEATHNSEEARAGTEPTNSEDRVQTGAAVTGTDNAAEEREPATNSQAERGADKNDAFRASVEVKSANTVYGNLNYGVTSCTTERPHPHNLVHGALSRTIFFP